MNKVVYIRYTSGSNSIPHNIQKKYKKLCKENDIEPDICDYFHDKLRTDRNFIQIIEELDPKLNKDPEYSIELVSDKYINCYKIKKSDSFYCNGEWNGINEKIVQKPIYLIQNRLDVLEKFIENLKEISNVNDNDS